MKNGKSVGLEVGVSQTESATFGLYFSFRSSKKRNGGGAEAGGEFNCSRTIGRGTDLRWLHP